MVRRDPLERSVPYKDFGLVSAYFDLVLLDKNKKRQNLAI